MSKAIDKQAMKHTLRLQNNMNHQDFNWKQITNKYKATCSVCNRSVEPGETILWNINAKLISHLPEMCQFLGTRKKRKSTRLDGTNPRAKGTNPLSKKQIEEERLAQRIDQYTFPVEVRYAN